MPRKKIEAPEGYISVREYGEHYGMTRQGAYFAIKSGRVETVEVEGLIFAKDDPPSDDIPAPKCPIRSCRGNYGGYCVWLTECFIKTKCECKFFKEKEGKKK